MHPPSPPQIWLEMAKDEQKRKLSAQKNNPSDDSKKQKKSPEAEPSGCWFVGEPVPAAEARKRWPERYKNNKVWVRSASFHFSFAALLVTVFFIFYFNE